MRYGPLHPLGWSNNSGDDQPIRFFGNLANPGEAYRRIRDILDQETQRARDQSPGDGNPTDDIYDAERHARASYRLQKEVGPAYATLGGYYHEMENLAAAAAKAVTDQKIRRGFADGSILRSTAMDLHNNAVGRAAAARGQSIPNRRTPELRPKP